MFYDNHHHHDHHDHDHNADDDDDTRDCCHQRRKMSTKLLSKEKVLQLRKHRSQNQIVLTKGAEESCRDPGSDPGLLLSRCFKHVKRFCFKCQKCS